MIRYIHLRGEWLHWVHLQGRNSYLYEDPSYLFRSLEPVGNEIVTFGV